MGNCCMSGSSTSMVWAGDDWGSMGRTGPDGLDSDEKEGLLGGGCVVAGASELRIKISKKQLEELLRWEDDVSPEISKDQLERLLEGSVRVEVRRSSWRPKLPTIPENYNLSCE